MRPANSNGDHDVISSLECGLVRGSTAQRRFIAAFMTVSTADDMLADGDIEGGVATYRRAIEICPPCAERADFKLLLGGILFEQGDAPGAATEISAALADGCSHPYEALRRLSFAQAAQGDFTAARQAMMASLEAGEEMAFATQALVIFDLAVGDLDGALSIAEPHAALADAETEYRCRLALACVELQRLAGNRAAALAELELAAELARQDALDAELALWLAALDRHFGRDDIRSDVAAAFAAEPDHWATLAWKILNGEGTRADLASRLGKMPETLRAENFAIFDRLTGLAAETAGDAIAARVAYQAARAVPFTQWCIDYHLAGVALAQAGRER